STEPPRGNGNPTRGESRKLYRRSRLSRINMRIRWNLQQAIETARDQPANMPEIVNELVEYQSENQDEAYIDQEVFPKCGRDKLTAAKGVNGQITYQADNTPGRANRYPVRHKAEHK